MNSPGDLPSTIIRVEGVNVEYRTSRSLLPWGAPGKTVLSNIHLRIARGKTLGLVGESGCGKTTLGRAITGLIPVESGKIYYYRPDGNTIELTELSQREFRPLRKNLQIIFQDPYSSLNPRMTVGEILTEGIKVHFPRMNRKEWKEKALHGLDLVGIAPSAMDRYPHEFSGGQRQRISIARAISLDVDFLICDESVSALDVSIQAQIINLFIDLQDRLNLSYLFISHDLSVVRHLSHRIAVMDEGIIVEENHADELLNHPQHPSTQRLLSAIPSLAPVH